LAFVATRHGKATRPDNRHSGRRYDAGGDIAEGTPQLIGTARPFRITMSQA